MINTKMSPNFTANANFKPIGLILHGTLGNYNGAIEWLCTPPAKRNPVSYSSAHFVIRKDGETTMLVDPKNESWHAGRISNPTYRARKYLPRKAGVPPIIPIPVSMYKNPNSYFIGIELEWFQGDIVTEAQYQAVVNVMKQYRIPNLVLAHSEITADKGDFGRTEAGMLPVQEVMRRMGKTG